MTNSSRKPDHWVVRMNHRNRTGAFVLLLLTLSSHMLPRHDGLVGWAVLIAAFLIYPQLAYQRSRRAIDPLRAEIQHMRWDTAMFGWFAGWLAFPLWITFILLMGGVVNLTAFRGVRGTWQALLAFGLGAAVGGLLNGFEVSLATRWPTTLLSIFCLALYLFTVANAAFERAVKLHDARNQLRENEKVMQARLTEISSLQAQLNDTANRDALTGLYNRRYLSSTMDREITRCQRERMPLAVLMLDADHFKRVNDVYGHPAGDEVLRQLGQMLASSVRASDVACRYGGEEFLILLPGMCARLATERAEHYRARFEAHRTTFDGAEILVTISIGVAVLPDHGQDPGTLVAAADRALYKAKTAGRNRVELSS